VDIGRKSEGIRLVVSEVAVYQVNISVLTNAASWHTVFTLREAG
jgi:hypothetical protein